VHVAAQATKTSITSVDPPRAPTGRLVNLRLGGVEPSKFHKVSLALHGQCNSSREGADVVIGDKWTNITVPSPGTYVLCYYQENLGDWQQQESAGVAFVSLPVAVFDSITSMDIQGHGSDPRGNSTTIVIPANTDVQIKFVGAKYSNLTRIAFAVLAGEGSCSDTGVLLGVTDLNTQLPSGDAQADYASVKLPTAGTAPTTYVVCYSAQGAELSDLWVYQSRLKLIVSPSGAPGTLLSAACVSSSVDVCMSDGSARASQAFDLALTLPIPSPFSYFAMAKPGFDCGSPSSLALETSFLDYTTAFTNLARVVITLPNITLDSPGTYTLCYSSMYDGENSYKQQKIRFNVSEVFERAVFSAAAQSNSTSNISQISAAGGSHYTATLKGDGFEASAHYSCQLRRGSVNSAETVATFKNSKRMSCQMPTWPDAAGAVFLTLLVRRSAGSAPVVVWKVGADRSEKGHQVMVVPEWQGFTPAMGGKLGGDVVTVSGYGFGVDPASQQPVGTYPAQRLYCNFSSAQGAVSSVDAVIIDSRTLTCITPLWSPAPWNKYDDVVNGTSQFELVAEWSQNQSAAVLGPEDTDDKAFRFE
jgi:hypothetical protein